MLSKQILCITNIFPHTFTNIFLCFQIGGEFVCLFLFGSFFISNKIYIFYTYIIFEWLLSIFIYRYIFVYSRKKEIESTPFTIICILNTLLFHILCDSPVKYAIVCTNTFVFGYGFHLTHTYTNTHDGSQKAFTELQIYLILLFELNK